MPEEQAPPAEAPPTDGAAPSAPEATETADGERPSGSDWFRETALGLTTRPLEATPRKQQWDEANAELRRGRRNGQEETRREAEPKEEAPPKGEAEEPKSSPRETDDDRFRRAVQAEVDRREAARNQRERSQRERQLRDTNPEEYAKYKRAEEDQNEAAGNLSQALRTLASQFDDATVTQVMNALSESARAEALKEPGHGIEGRKEIMKRGIAALKKASYDEGFAKGKESAEKSLRRSSSFRKELLTELRGEEEEPDLAPANGRAGAGFSMNDWMRAATGRRTGATSREE